MLQISDVIAYTFGRKYNVNDSTYYDIISPLIFEQDGKHIGKGQKIWPD